MQDGHFNVARLSNARLTRNLVPGQTATFTVTVPAYNAFTFAGENYSELIAEVIFEID